MTPLADRLAYQDEYQLAAHVRRVCRFRLGLLNHAAASDWLAYQDDYQLAAHEILAAWCFWFCWVILWPMPGWPGAIPAGLKRFLPVTWWSGRSLLPYMI